MSSSESMVSIQGLSKSYTISHGGETHTTAAEALLHRLRRPFQRPQRETFWALQDVSADIHAGDVVGIIGRNGAGKSTLLKVLSRITDPTGGQVDLYGRVGSLLEVGTGFHPELTGRENIYLNGSLLGMGRREINRHFDAIVAFADVERFLDTPVKRYSSGMYVRLAFAVAAHLDSEILVVDEVLAVGDAEFQRKCLGKMRDVATSGRTVLFVSHHMQSVSALCTRALYLERGRVTYDGDVPGAIERYTRSFAEPAVEAAAPERRPGTGELRFASVTAGKEFFACGEEKTIRFTVEPSRPFAGKYFVSGLLVDERGFTLLHFDSRTVGHWIEGDAAYEGELTFRTPWLRPGNYRLDLFICSAGIIDRFEQACVLRVIPLLPYPESADAEATAHGVVFADYSFATADSSLDRSDAVARSTVGA